MKNWEAFPSIFRRAEKTSCHSRVTPQTEGAHTRRPTAGLDPKAHKDILAYPQRSTRRKNTIILASHNGDSRSVGKGAGYAQRTSGHGRNAQEVFSRAEQLMSISQ